MAPMLGPPLRLLLALEPVAKEAVPVSVTTAPLDPVIVYVIGFPVASGPAVAVSAGAVMVAPPLPLPPMTDWMGIGTWYP